MLVLWALVLWAYERAEVCAQSGAVCRSPLRGGGACGFCRYLIFTAGACPLNEDGSTAAVGDYPGQAVKTMDNLALALEAAGAGFPDLVKTTIYVAATDRSALVEVWDTVKERLGDHDVPSTLIGVTVLGYPDQLVEVEAVAALGLPPAPSGPDKRP